MVQEDNLTFQNGLGMYAGFVGKCLHSAVSMAVEFEDVGILTQKPVIGLLKGRLT